MDDSDRGPRSDVSLPTTKEIAEEVYSIGRENGVEPSKVIVFGSYASDDYTSESDADVVVVSSEIDEDDFYRNTRERTNPFTGWMNPVQFLNPKHRRI